MSSTAEQLPSWRSVLAVVAHPDDESFGLGAVLSAFTARARVSVLCFTHGEASTLHGVPGELRGVRERELRAAAQALQLDDVTLLDHPDGGLPGVPHEELVTDVLTAATHVGAEGLVVFDPSGVTGHPDHQTATRAALTAGARDGVPTLAWTLPAHVAEALNTEFGASFTGHPAAEIDILLPVDRTRQLSAVACHPSQAVPSSVLWRRLELLGTLEHLRWVSEHTQEGPRQ